MAKPIALQKLRHGKALCGKTFGGFVDTFNWLVDFCSGLKGDSDDGGGGTAKVDRSDPSAPVVRVGGGGDGIDVVVGVEYDTTDHKFYMYTRKVKAVFADGDIGSAVRSEVFATTPLSGSST